MKFAAALSLALAPVALAKAVHSIYPVRRDVGLSERSQSSGLTAEAALLSNAALILGSQRDVIIIWVNAGGSAATSTVNAAQTVTTTVTSTTTLANAATTVAAAAGTTHSVTVGGSKGLVYEPDSITAAIGDMVVFTFMSQNHTVTQSSFATPCEFLAGGMDSGFQPNPNNTISPAPQVAMQVMVDTPLWFYCAQKGHCGKGMVFSINPTANKTQAIFQQMAIAQNGTGTDTTITGGSSNSTSSSAISLSATKTTATATTAASTGVVTGTGTTNADGSCACVVQCSFGSFPAVQAQGVGAFGGMAGTL